MGAAGFEAAGGADASRGSPEPETLIDAGSDARATAEAAETRGERVTRDPDPDHLPSAVPSFLEACAKLAGEAAARGDFTRARELVEKAARVAALRAEVA
jgi:hypothetical protein